MKSSQENKIKKKKQQTCERVYLLVLKNYIASHAKPLLKRAGCCRPGCDMPKQQEIGERPIQKKKNIFGIKRRIEEERR